MLSVNKERFQNIHSEMKPLMEASWQEVKGEPLNLDYDSYYKLEQVGIIHLFTLRDEKELVGYWSYQIFPHSFDQDLLVANHLSMFVKKEYRGWKVSKCIKEIEKILAEYGAKKVYYHMPPGSGYDKWIKRMGCAPCETVYEKELQ